VVALLPPKFKLLLSTSRLLRPSPPLPLPPLSGASPPPRPPSRFFGSGIEALNPIGGASSTRLVSSSRPGVLLRNGASAATCFFFIIIFPLFSFMISTAIGVAIDAALRGNGEPTAPPPSLPSPLKESSLIPLRFKLLLRFDDEGVVDR
jgi:hypothetical protein